MYAQLEASSIPNLPPPGTGFTRKWQHELRSVLAYGVKLDVSSGTAEQKKALVELFETLSNGVYARA